MTDNINFKEDQALWENDLSSYTLRDNTALGPFVLVTVVRDDGSRHVVEGYYDGTDWWLSGMSKDCYTSAPMEDCVGTPIAYRELPEPFAGLARPAFSDPKVIQFPVREHRNPNQ